MIYKFISMTIPWDIKTESQSCYLGVFLCGLSLTDKEMLVPLTT